MRSCIVICVVLLIARSIRAELPLIRLDRIFPLGGSAGGKVTLEIQGRDLDDAKELRFDHPGVKARWLKDKQFEVSIAADTPPGMVEARAIGRFGISGVRLFAVSHGLTEVAEKEPNDTPDSAQPVPMNAAINGASDGNGDDFYRFPAKKGERVVIDCQAFRLDSTLRAILAVSTTDGRELARSKPYYHRTDPLVDVVIPADGDYVIRLHDMTFNGGLPYRLVVSNLPQIENAFPNVIAPGVKTDLQVLGRNLAGGKASAAWSVQDVPLDVAALSFTLPKDPLALHRFPFRNHLLSPSLNARGVQLWPDTWKHALNPVTLHVTDAPVTLDAEPNDTPDSAQQIKLPTVIAGRFDKPGDIDWFAFTAKAGDTYSVDLLCERLDLPGDPFVIFFDDKGKEVGNFDDHGVNFNALAQFNRDPLGTFRVPADGVYRAVVQERYRNGGARYQYVLRLTKAVPDFAPVVVHETNPDPTCPALGRGGSAFVEVCLNRRDYAGPVVIEAAGLPPGVTCLPTNLSAQAQTGCVVFTATNEAVDWAGPIRLKAWALVDGQKIEREVRPCQRRWAIANISTSIMLRETCLAVREQAPYAVKLPVEKATVAAGGSFEAKATAARHWPDFKGKIQLNGLDLPPGFAMPTAEIAPGSDAVTLKFTVAANVPPGDYTVTVRGDAQVPYSRDAKATTSPNVRVADPASPMVVMVTAAAAKKKG